jgi:hypothetical protein
MREYTWLDRPASWSNLRVFVAILERLSLARAWGAPRTRQSGPASLWIDWADSERLDPNRGVAFQEWCDSMIGGRTPEEALVEFGRAVRLHEAAVAQLVIGRDGLNAVSRAQGFQAGVAAGHEGRIRVSPGGVPSLGACAWAIRQSALGWLDWPSQEPWLVERDIPGRLDGVLQECPHQDPLVGDRTIRDFLCAQHFEWFRGLADSLDLRVSIQERPREPGKDRCRVGLAWNAEAGS